MKRILKITGWAFFILLLLILGVGVYFYTTEPMVKAIVNNDESKLFYFPSKEMDSMDELNYSESVLKIEDSIEVYTYQFKPSTEKKACVFFIHGAGGNVSSYKSLIKPLIKNGFEVYAFDWRGYGKSTGVPGYKGVMKDTEIAYEDFLKRKAKDTLKTIVYGMSLGGPMAIEITRKNENTVNALILDGTIASAQDIAIDYAPVNFLKERHRESPEKFNQDYVGVRDVSLIENVPKLIIHSIKDRDVPFKHGRKVFKAAKEPKEFWKTETAHIMTLRDLSDEAIKRIENTLNKD